MLKLKLGEIEHAHVLTNYLLITNITQLIIYWHPKEKLFLRRRKHTLSSSNNNRKLILGLPSIIIVPDSDVIRKLLNRMRSVTKIKAHFYHTSKYVIANLKICEFVNLRELK